MTKVAANTRDHKTRKQNWLPDIFTNSVVFIYCLQYGVRASTISPTGEHVFRAQLNRPIRIRQRELPSMS
jgi:hypothetical protein